MIRCKAMSIQRCMGGYFRLFLVLVTLSQMSCSSSGDDSAAYGERCSSSADCTSGLICSASGGSVGLCTKECGSGTTCLEFGANDYCQTLLTNPICARRCNTNDGCPSGTCLIDTLDGTGLYCVP